MFQDVKTKRFFPYILLAPMFLIQLVVVIGPSLLNIGYAFTEWNGLSKPIYIGLDNFKNLFNDRIFWVAIKHNIQWAAFFLTIPILLAMLAAVLASRVRRGQMFFRLVFFIPFIIAPVVNAQIWRNILHPVYGLGVWLSNNLGWTWADVGYFSNRGVVLWSIANVDNWHWWGFLMVLYLSAMQSIPMDLYDAARVDGASLWQEFIHVVIPGIRPTLIYTLVMSMTGSFLIFDYVWILTQGGPANSSEVLGSYMYKTAFYKLDVGYASAIALGMTAIAASFTAVFAILRRLDWEV